MLFSYFLYYNILLINASGKSGDIPAFPFFKKGFLIHSISTRTAAAEVRNITASAQSEAGMV